jgi:hypothetical protein
MYAIYDENPFPSDSLSFKIWQNNRQAGTGLLSSAGESERYIIYLYVMGKTLVKIARISGRSPTAISLLLEKYHVKLDRLGE